MKRKPELVAIPKTMEGLRDALFDEIIELRGGRGNLQRARAVAQLASQAIDSIRVQIQYSRMLTKAKEDGPVLLGSSEKS